MIKLTEREQEVFKLYSLGCEFKLIAHMLGITISTVKFHLANIKQKYGVFLTCELRIIYFNLLLESIDTKLQKSM